jgi:hypothetical protein
MVAKLLEMGALVMAIAAVAPFVRTVGSSAGGSTLGRTAVAGLAVVAALGLLLLALSRLAPRLAERLRGGQRWPRVVHLLEAVTAGVRGAGSLRRLALGLLAAFGPVAAAGLAYGLALAHAGAPSGVLGGWLLLGALTLGQFTPGLPVGAGVYLFVCSWAARTLGASDAAAAAVAVLSHAGAVIANLAVGSVSAVRYRGELREVLRWRRGARSGGTPSAPGVKAAH